LASSGNWLSPEGHADFKLTGLASPGNWLSPDGHADFKNPVDDPSLCHPCSFPLKLFNDEAETVSSLSVIT